MCPYWEGEAQNGSVRNLLSVNKQIHDEAENLLYSRNTLFFKNAFDLDRVGVFLDTLSPTARSRIRSVGFEVFFFVHSQSGVPKRCLKQYEQAGKLLAQKLPRWEGMVFYLDPRFYFPDIADADDHVGGRELSARGVLYLASIANKLRKDVVFHPTPFVNQHALVDREAERLLMATTATGHGYSSTAVAAAATAAAAAAAASASTSANSSSALSMHMPMVMLPHRPAVEPYAGLIF